ncbi:MAG: TrkA family potassium uptake protein [Acidothermus sp.]|nr:TrkA family potassium uptake protein [Acidothermus sp.]MCL6537142.1 TrkA family potassium uptake protein [Acidothermus sp.]
MHVVILGCGRVGATLADSLERLGHSVSIIDQDAHAFRRLPPDFRGHKVHGFGLHRSVLEESGIQHASAFAAVSNGDNSNIISARLAREVFGVENVVARIYDIRRAEIYQRLGIPTVATVKWTADQILRRVLPSGAQTLWRDPTGTMALSEVHVDPSWIGHRLTDLEEAAGVRIAFVTRFGAGVLPTPETVLQEGDLVYVMAPEGRLERAADILGRPREPERERA